MKPKIKEGDFYKEINQAIDEGRHVGYLRSYLKQYEIYKKFFDNTLTDKNPKHQVYKFKFNYLGKKPVWRVFEICGCQQFDILAEAVTDSMEWYNDHLHMFCFPETRGKSKILSYSMFSINSPHTEDDPYPTLKTDEVKIENVDYSKYPKLRFIFDFGDDHEFDVEFKGMRKLDKDEVVDEFPRMIDIRGVAPEQYPPCPDE